MYKLEKTFSSNPEIEHYLISYEDKNVAILRLQYNSNKKMKLFYVISKNINGHIISPTLLKESDTLETIQEKINRIPLNTFPKLIKRVVACFNVGIITKLDLRYLVDNDGSVVPTNSTHFMNFCTEQEAEDYIVEEKNISKINDILYKIGDIIEELKVVPLYY